MPDLRAAESPTMPIHPDLAGQPTSRHPAVSTPYQPAAAFPPAPQRPLGSPPSGPPPSVRGPKAWYRRGAPLAAIATVLAVIAVLIAVSLGGSSNPSSPAADLPTAQPTSDASTPSTELTESTLPVTTSPAAPTVPSVTPAGVNIAAVRTNPHIAAVADLFDRYFIATNAHDGSDLVEIFDPAGVTKSDTADGVAKWQSEVATSYDDEMALTAIRDYSAVPGGLLVHATFRSQQDPSLGPDGQSCTHWDLVYRLTPYAAGYRVLGAQQVMSVAC
ncbi:MAG: hypothetical protein ACJ74U_07505 [Jatrophihabitantaceae bacterium]